MKTNIQALILGSALILTEAAFSQTAAPAANPVPNPVNTPVPNTLQPQTPLQNPVNPNQPINGINPRQDHPGPAVSDRDKVSCLSNQEAVIQGDRVVCITRYSQPTDPTPRNEQPKTPQNF